MLSSLTIKNYALIENLKVDFQDELSIITGETGAGKSILLGGLSLVLGKRADSSLANNKDKKCVIEAEFAIDNYNLQSFFELEDLDYDINTTIRREILPSGKSRAFVNDTPTTLKVLNELSGRLIDIHSQHETLQLADSSFQFQIIDALANNKAYLESYTRELILYKKLSNELNLILENHQKMQLEFDFDNFILEELKQSELINSEQAGLENELEKLSHAEDIKLNLIEAIQISENEDLGLKNLLYQVKFKLENVANFSKKYRTLSDRINSLAIELDDIVGEMELENDRIVYSPSELERINDRIQLIYNLQKKHGVSSIKELLEIQESLETKIDEFENIDRNIDSKKKEISSVKEELEKLSLKIHERRETAIPIFIKKLEALLSNLKMKDTRLSIHIIPDKEFFYNGKDKLEFLISANKGLSFEKIHKTASGGEMSRIMLAIKKILSDYTHLPTIIFDEIDTGVSGEVSNKIAGIMMQMGENMQVISITHLPQIASRGKHHYKVFKKEINNKINSNIRLLNNEERITELAEMLGGKKITKTAIDHAKQLLNL